MSHAANQARTLLRLLAGLQPHWRSDPGLPARLQAAFARHREFGARDRRLYRELVFTTLRHLPWIEPLLGSAPDEAVRRVAWLAADTPATKIFRAEFATGEPPAGDKKELLPAWFRAHCPEIFTGAELDTQLRRAPLWLRLQTPAPQSVLDEFSARGWTVRPSAILPAALAVLGDVDVTQTAVWREGRIEVQDLGSQLVLESVGVEPGGHWLDACAGAGGKTLQLATLLGPTGRVDAHDIRPAALEELARRAARARIPVCHLLNDNLQDRPGSEKNDCHLLNDTMAAAIAVTAVMPATAYDGVLVDAPCSGSGTWRRAPHLKWTTTEETIARATAQQRAILAAASARVRPGGRLVYATCSLSSRENEDVIAAFLADHPEFEPGPWGRDFGLVARGAGRLLLPARHDTDGFFVASLRRR